MPLLAHRLSRPICCPDPYPDNAADICPLSTRGLSHRHLVSLPLCPTPSCGLNQQPDICLATVFLFSPSHPIGTGDCRPLLVSSEAPLIAGGGASCLIQFLAPQAQCQPAFAVLLLHLHRIATAEAALKHPLRNRGIRIRTPLASNRHCHIVQKALTGKSQVSTG
jgi:hypothetical protein